VRNSNKYRWLREICVRVLPSIGLGGLIGYRWPEVGISLQPLADGLIKSNKMLLSPIVFGTVVFGMAKLSAGAAGAGFVTLAATLSSIHTIPVAGLVLSLSVDRFMNEGGAVTNLIGKGVATIAIAKWDGALNREQAMESMRLHREGDAKSDAKSIEYAP
jgi:Na+/H+-dicarboxylate symporter